MKEAAFSFSSLSCFVPSSLFLNFFIHFIRLQKSPQHLTARSYFDCPISIVSYVDFYSNFCRYRISVAVYVFYTNLLRPTSVQHSIVLFTGHTWSCWFKYIPIKQVPSTMLRLLTRKMNIEIKWLSSQTIFNQLIVRFHTIICFWFNLLWKAGLFFSARNWADIF